MKYLMKNRYVSLDEESLNRRNLKLNIIFKIIELLNMYVTNKQLILNLYYTFIP